MGEVKGVEGGEGDGVASVSSDRKSSCLGTSAKRGSGSDVCDGLTLSSSRLIRTRARHAEIGDASLVSVLIWAGGVLPAVALVRPAR